MATTFTLFLGGVQVETLPGGGEVEPIRVGPEGYALENSYGTAFLKIIRAWEYTTVPLTPTQLTTLMAVIMPQGMAGPVVAVTGTLMDNLSVRVLVLGTSATYENGLVMTSVRFRLLAA